MDPQGPVFPDGRELLYCTGAEPADTYTSMPETSSGGTIAFKSAPVKSGRLTPSTKMAGSQGLDVPMKTRSLAPEPDNRTPPTSSRRRVVSKGRRCSTSVESKKRPKPDLRR